MIPTSNSLHSSALNAGRAPAVQIQESELSSHAAEMAWIWESCLHCLPSWFLPGIGWQYRCPASGFRRYSSFGKPSLDRGFCNLARGVQISANICETAFLHTVRKREVFQSRDCCCVSLEVEQNALQTSSTVKKSCICSCRAKHHIVGRTRGGAAWVIWKLEMQFVQRHTLHESAEPAKYFSELLEYLTDSMLHIYNLLSLPVHYGLELCVWIQQHQGSTRHSNGAAQALQHRSHCQDVGISGMLSRSWLKEANRQSAGLSDAVLNEGNAAMEGQLGPPLFQISVAHFKHLSVSGHLCKPKVNENHMQQF